MAKKSSVRLSFPLLGINRNWAAYSQPGLTTPDAQNVRPYDVLKKRARGGPRPSLRKLFAQQIGGAAKRIDALCQVAIGYVTLGSGSEAISNGPTPDPMTWYEVPVAIDMYSVTMTATTATSPVGYDIEYYFANVTDPTHDSGWQDSTIFIDTGLSENTEYTYKVKARDKSVTKNETAYSAEASATTATKPVDITPPTYTPGVDGLWDTVPYAYQTGWDPVAGRFTGMWYHRMVAVACTDADSPPVRYHFFVRSGLANSSGWLQRPDPPGESGTMEFVNGPFLVPNDCVYRIDVADAAGNTISSSMYSTNPSIGKIG